MLHIIQSNRMEALQAQLHKVLDTAPLDSIFSKEIILVQSPGMSQWLKLGVSQHSGLAAQLDFPLPSSFIWQLYQTFLPQVPKESPFNKANLTWKLMTLLPEQLGLSVYEPLKRYLEDDEAGKKRFALCEKIADVFDQYLMYRPEWLDTWESGMDELPDVDVSIAPWQPDLWRKLVLLTEDLGQSPYHRANMHGMLLEALTDASAERLPQRISLFGLSAIPSSQLEIFQALAQKTNVLLFLFNPSEHYWGDVVDEKTQAKIAAKFVKYPELEAQSGEYFQIGNPLLSAWGKLGRDYFEQLLQLDASWIDGFVEDFSDNLLGKVQKEIFDLSFKGETLVENTQWFINQEGQLSIEEDDNSIVFQDSHTPLREIERLHDHILALMHEDPSLTPKDFIVMMPDVAKYSPYIEAVFGGATAERYIPYSLADLAIDQEKPVINSFLSLVDLPFSRFGVSDILDLFAVEPIAKQYQCSEDEFEQFRFWLEEVGVRWGINAEHKAEHELPKMQLNTWQQGLNRLLLGIAMSDESLEFEGIFPSDQVEGMATESLSKLIHFIDDLISHKNILSEHNPLDIKAEQLKSLIKTFYHPDSDQSWDLQVLNKVIETLQTHFDNKDMLEAVSPEIISYWVKQGVAQKGVGQRFLVGAVNFCTLMPMRAVPFKVVCLLGLNDGDYPRSVQPIGFDLVSQSQRKKGDRSRKLDDRYLFLEALLSARQQLLLSYVGRSCYNNEPQVPSILVSELIDYIDRCFYIEGNASKPSAYLLNQATLQPFSTLNYIESDQQSFNPTWLISKAAKEQPSNKDNESFNEGLPNPFDTTDHEVDINQLIRAVLNPQAAFYQQRVGVRLYNAEEVIDDDEPFALDALSRYQYLDELLTDSLNDSEKVPEQLLQRGDLPQAEVGKVQLGQLQQRITPLAERLKTTLTSPSEPVEIDIDCGAIKLQGWLDKLFTSQQIFYRPASIKAKDKLRAFIYHCAANCMGQSVTTSVYGLDEQVSFAPLEAEEAKIELQKWVNFYISLMSSPQPFFVSSSYEYALTEDINKAANKFNGGQYIGMGDSENPYVALDFKNLFDFEAEFVSLSKSLFGKLIDLAKEEKYANA
ncbi:exodeoxyribonuclease V subunit gamma [Pseudoalteromonas sp. BZB3]|uniref:exodeoxyribonuclease V subunit gamma n=1 Tax=Pseudoalteromonas sp. BZB3 TaxID=3136670 RepID=UPI0032C4833A